ncbi:MAG: hypothetical protein RR393_05990 [Bacteroidales bacterium]
MLKNKKITVGFICFVRAIFVMLCLGVNIDSIQAAAASSSSSVQKDTVNQLDKKGRKQGFWAKEDSSPKVSYRGYFKDDMPVGWFEYRSGDTLMAKSFYFRGGYASFSQIYYPHSGGVLAEGYYLDKRKDSVWKFYRKDGRLLKVENFEKGLKNGEAKLYAADGSLFEDQQWYRGLRHGPWWRHDQRGYEISTYNLNKTTGCYTVLYADSTPYIKGQYEDGIKQGLWSFYFQGGALYKEDVYKNNKLIDRSFYLKIKGVLNKIDKDTVSIIFRNPQGRAELLTENGTRLVCDETFDLVCRIFDLDFFFYANPTTFVAFQIVDISKLKKENFFVNDSIHYDMQANSNSNLEEMGKGNAVQTYLLPLQIKTPFPIYMDANGIHTLRNNLNNSPVKQNEN